MEELAGTEIRTIHQKPRRCSKSRARTERAFYLVSEAFPDGVLPLIIEVDPPVPVTFPEEHPLGRVPLLVDLDLVLQGEPYEAFISGSSADRLRRQELLEPEIAAFGMPIQTRKSIGICRTHGLEAIQGISPSSISLAGLFLRNLAAMAGDRFVGEVITCFSRQNWPGMLAALWRGWRAYPPEKKKNLRPIVALLMTSIGAGADALEL